MYQHRAACVLDQCHDVPCNGNSKHSIGNLKNLMVA